MSQLHVNYLFIPLLISLFSQWLWDMEVFLALRHKRLKNIMSKNVTFF